MSINNLEIFFQKSQEANIHQSQITYLQTQQIVIYVFCALIFLYFVLTIVFVPIIKKRKDDKNLKKRWELYKSLKPGHEVLLAGGIFGEVVDKQGEIYFIEVAPQVVIKINRNYILGFFDQEIANKINDKKVKEVHSKTKIVKNKNLTKEGENNGV